MFLFLLLRILAARTYFLISAFTFPTIAFLVGGFNPNGILLKIRFQLNLSACLLPRKNHVFEKWRMVDLSN